MVSFLRYPAEKIFAAVCAAAFMFSLASSAGAFSAEEFQVDDFSAEEASTYEFQTGEASYGSDEPVTLAVPLDPLLCTPIDEYIFSDSAQPDAKETKKIEASMRGFYEKTGIQPYLYFTENEAGNVREWLREKYAELFGADGGHLLVYFALTGKPGMYDMQYYPGSDAETLIDYAAGEYFSDCIDECSDRGFSYEDTFRTAFENTAEFIIYGTQRDIFDKTEQIGFSPGAVPAPGATAAESETDGEEAEKPDTTALPIIFAVFVFCITVIAGATVKRYKSDKAAAGKKTKNR